MILSLDVESRSKIDLKKAGAHRYWEDPSTSLWCACFAFDDEPVQLWLPGQPCPERVFAHVWDGGTISAWNAGFEFLAWRHTLAPVHGWPAAPIEQFEDTEAAGAAMGLPHRLERAAPAMRSPFLKDEEGHNLMMRMGKPRRPSKDDPRVWWDHPERLERLCAYCAQDVEAERWLRNRLIPLDPAERETWMFNQRMNDRGVAIDMPLVHALKAIVEQELERLDDEMDRVTGGAVTRCTQVARLKEWLLDRGVSNANSLDKAAIEEMLTWDLPVAAERALLLRKEAAKSSTAKLDAMLACVCADGRARGLHLYHGAGTGRWAGRLIQTQNMPRGTGTVKDPEAAVPDFMRASAEWVDHIYG